MRLAALKGPAGLRIAAALILLLAGASAGGTALLQGWRDDRIARALTGGDPALAPDLIRRYGCGGCHSVAAVPGADGQVGPPLGGLRQRVFIAGVARNAPESLIAWIVSPQSLSPNSAMPATGITPAEARDVAAFLYAH